MIVRKSLVKYCKRPPKGTPRWERVNGRVTDVRLTEPAFPVPLPFLLALDLIILLIDHDQIGESSRVTSRANAITTTLIR
jgi:hypothetical protein